MPSLARPFLEHRPKPLRPARVARRRHLRCPCAPVPPRGRVARADLLHPGFRLGPQRDHTEPHGAHRRDSCPGGGDHAPLAGLLRQAAWPGVPGTVTPVEARGISPPRELPVEVRRAGSRCPLTDTATPATALIVA